MIDLHTHSLFSDGVLIPSELARRAEHAGLTGSRNNGSRGFFKHRFYCPEDCGCGNRPEPVHEDKGHSRELSLPTCPRLLIAECARRARNLGARIIIVHGETIAEPVAPGTNRAAIDADVNILAHPGLISMEEVLMAKEKGILLEISARKGHSLTNGHVAKLAAEAGAKLVINTDTHEPSDLINRDQAIKVVRGAGLTEEDFNLMQQNASAFL